MNDLTLHQAFAKLGYYSTGRAAFPAIRCRQYQRPVFRGGRLIQPMTSVHGWAYLAKVERKLAALRAARGAS